MKITLSLQEAEQIIKAHYATMITDDFDLEIEGFSEPKQVEVVQTVEQIIDQTLVEQERVRRVVKEAIDKANIAHGDDHENTIMVYGIDMNNIDFLYDGDTILGYPASQFGNTPEYRAKQAKKQKEEEHKAKEFKRKMAEFEERREKTERLRRAEQESAEYKRLEAKYGHRSIFEADWKEWDIAEKEFETAKAKEAREIEFCKENDLPLPFKPKLQGTLFRPDGKSDEEYFAEQAELAEKEKRTSDIINGLDTAELDALTTIMAADDETKEPMSMNDALEAARKLAEEGKKNKPSGLFRPVEEEVVIEAEVTKVAKPLFANATKIDSEEDVLNPELVSAPVSKEAPLYIPDIDLPWADNKEIPL